MVDKKCAVCECVHESIQITKCSCYFSTCNLSISDSQSYDYTYRLWCQDESGKTTCSILLHYLQVTADDEI